MGLRYQQSPIALPDLPDGRMQVRASIPLKSRFWFLTGRELIRCLIVPLKMVEVVEVVSLPQSCGALREGREVVDLPDDLEGLALVAMVHNG